MAEANGKPVDGPVDLQLAFYAQETGDNPILAQPLVVSGVVLVDGVFQLTLDLDPSDFQLLTAGTEAPFIEVTDLTHSKTYPRQTFGVVPYALKIPVDGKTATYNANGELTVGPIMPPAAGQFLTKDTGGNFVWATPPSIATSLGGQNVSTATPLNGQVLAFDGAQWIAQTISGTGTVTSVGVTAPLVVTTPTTTPQLSLPAATTAVDGYLKATDWTAFNAKEPAITAGAAGTYFSGNKTWQTLTSDAAVEGTTNKYFTDARAQAAAVDTAITPGVTTKAPNDDVVATALAGKQATISSSTDLTVGSLTTSKQAAVSVGPASGAATGEVRFMELLANGANYVGLKAPDSLAGNKVWTLPAADGAAGQMLKTDGFGVLGWVSGAAPSGTAGGDLSGTYPNPTIANSAVTSAKIAAGTIVDSNISATAAIASSKISGLGTAAALDVGVAANNVVQLATGGKLPAVDGSQLTALSAANVSGTLGVAHGGTGLASGTSGGVPYFSAGTTIASSAALTANGVMLGGGAGAAPTATTAGTSNQVFVVPGAGGAPGFGQLNLASTAAVTGVLDLTNGGTGADLHATGGAGKYLKQTSAGAAVSVANIAVADLPAMGASGASHSAGAVPDPGASSGTAKFLREDATWADPTTNVPWSTPGTIGSTTPNTGAFTTLTTTGAVGINKTSPGSQLEIKGTGTTSTTSGLNVTNSGGVSSLFVRDDGFVGLGTTAPIGSLDIRAAANTTTFPGLPWVSALFSTTAADINVGAGVVLGGLYNVGTPTTFGIMSGVKENASAGDAAGALLFATRTNITTVSEKMRIGSNGYVGVGTSAPLGRLQVNGTVAPAAVGVEDELVLARALNGAVSHANYAVFSLGRYANGTAQSNSRLDLKLNNSATDDTLASLTTVMTMQANGNIGIGSTAPVDRLAIGGASANVRFDDLATAHILRMGSGAESVRGAAITFGAVDTTNSIGGDLTLASGYGSGAGQSGNILLQAANAVASPGAGGSITLRAGDSSSTATGGNVLIVSGSSVSQSTGTVTLKGADAGTSTSGGVAYVTGGESGTMAGSGGDVYLTAGSRLNTHVLSSAGNVYIRGGVDNQSGGTAGGARDGSIQLQTDNGGSYLTRLFVNGNTGNIGIGTVTPSNTLHVLGSVCVKASGNCAGSTGGTIYVTNAVSTGADVAEHMPIEDKSLVPGDVVAVERSSASGEGVFAKATSAYQKTAVGVVSTNPGVTLGSDTKSSQPVALAGRVPVNVTLEGGAISVGDYLVASSTPGKAMKAKDLTRGGILGVALTAYDGTPIAAKDYGDGIAHESGDQVLMLVQTGIVPADAWEQFKKSEQARIDAQMGNLQRQIDELRHQTH